jgi:pSer/pThr/pTyr-binding forkhead associated (FHA) protein
MIKQAKLIVKAGGEVNKTYDLDQEKLVIGRDPKCEIVFSDIEVSRNHVEIIQAEDSFQIKDLDSTNGTFLNGRKIKKPVDLNNGDLISIGKNYVLEFIIEPEEKELATDQQIEVDLPNEEMRDEEVSMDEETSKRQFLKKKDKTRKPKREKTRKGDNEQKKPTWVRILLIALAFIFIFCVIPLIVIEATNQWCNLFPGVFNSISPGVCP